MNNSTLNYSTFSGPYQDSADIQTSIYSKQTASARAVKFVLLIIIILTSMVGNVLVLRFVLSNRRRLTATNILILSQSLADLGTTIFVIPFAAVSVVKNRWVFGHDLCVASGFLNMYFTVVTLLNLSLIALDRYYAVVRCSSSMRQRTSTIWTIVCTWTGAFLLSFPWLPLLSDKVVMGYFPGFYICGQRFMKPIGGLETGIYVLTCMCCVFCPLCVIIHSFHQISMYIHGKHHRISPIAFSTAQKLSMDLHAKSAHTSLMVNVTSIIQVFPACIMMAVDGLQLLEIPYEFETSLKWIMWCHCIVKPMIYAVRKKNTQDNLSIYAKLVNFINPGIHCIVWKIRKINARNSFWRATKYNVKTPSVIFREKNKDSRKIEIKNKCLKNAWSLENDFDEFHDISITFTQT